MSESQPVHVTGHTGEALIIERNTSHIEYFQRRDMAEWPDDERAQRAWCLDRVLAAKPLQIAMPGEDKRDWVADNVVWAERYRAWINGA
jgi:hypothetical protein